MSRRRSVVAALGVAATTAATLLGSVGPAAADPPAPPTVTIVGSGFGHGIGLSQWGAYGQAVEGRTGEQIAGYYYTGTTVAAYADATPIRVNVAHAVSSLTISSVAVAEGGGHWQLTTDANTPTAATSDLSPTDSVTLSAVDTTLSVALTRAGGAAVVAPYAANTIDLAWAGSGALAAEPATVLLAGSDQLRHGTLSVRPSSLGGGSKGRLEAVNSLRLHDEYLYGIAEVPSSWPREALRAQVIAARTYALDKMLRSPAGLATCGYCHLYDSTLSQVFAGWKKEAEVAATTDYGARWREAVDSTAVGADAGLTVLDAGVPIQAYFFSSSGGRTRNSEDVWSAALPYTRSVDDHWSVQPQNPNASWTVTVPAATVAAVFGFADLASIAVSSRDAGGAAHDVSATATSTVAASVSGEAFRKGLGLKSAWITSITLSSAAAAPAPTPTPTVTPTVAPPPPVKVPPHMASVYTTPGSRTVGGRLWQTMCVDYAHTHRCLAKVTASHAVRRGKTYAIVVGLVPSGWAYTTLDSVAWSRSPYSVVGDHVVGSAHWRTTCDVPTGPRLCRASLLTTLPTRTSVRGRYVWKTRKVYVLNRTVRLLGAPA